MSPVRQGVPGQGSVPVLVQTANARAKPERDLSLDEAKFAGDRATRWNYSASCTLALLQAPSERHLR